MGKYYSVHDFYCLKCGNKGLPIQRGRNLQREKFHRKKLYCIHCKEEVNHIECRNELEVKKFLKNFKEGKYIDEADASISFIRGSGVGKKHLR